MRRKLRRSFYLYKKKREKSIARKIKEILAREVVRGVAGVARATPIFQVLFHKTLSPQTLKPPKPSNPQALKTLSPQALKPLSI